MELAISIGNSTLQIAIQENNNLHIESNLINLLNDNDIIEIFKKICEGKTFEYCIISSVNPKFLLLVCGILNTSYNIEPIILNLNNEFNIDFKNYKSNLGIDRAVCCEAALLQVSLPFAMIDFGTATTINIVDSRGVFRGGMILPGIRMGLDALNKNTAFLPEVFPKGEFSLIGNSTEECIMSGAVFGTSILLENVLNKIWIELGLEGEVIITGGNAGLITPHLNIPFIYEPNLIIKGLFYILNRITAI